MGETYKLFIGRWSPFHEGHQYIIDAMLNCGYRVCIAIRDTKMSIRDPFPAQLRKKLIDKYYKDNKNVKTIIIPDIDQVCVGRKVGYSIMQVPENIKKISGTKKRELKTENWNEGKGKVFWFTGMPCSGKTTLMNELAKRIKEDYAILDGDIFRKEVTPHLGFSDRDRNDNVVTAAKIARQLKDQGVTVLCGFVSPTEYLRKNAALIIGDNFHVIHVKASIETCKKRDVKGMWKRAELGQIKNFTGYNAIYEEPRMTDLIINTEKDINECINELLTYYKEV